MKTALRAILPLAILASLPAALAGAAAFQPPDEANASPLRLTLDEPLGESGALTFWFKTDRAYRSGAGQPSAHYKLVEAPGSFAVSFDAEPSTITLAVEWGGAQKKTTGGDIRIILPEFPGPQWHHFALSWDAATARLNAYLDGTPYYVPGEKVSPVKIQPARELVLHPAPFALAGARLSRTPLPDDFAATLLPATQRGQMDALLGARDLGTLKSRPGKTLYANTLSTSETLAGWKMEGPALLTFNDGWMEINSARPDGPEGHLVYWCPVEFPDRFSAEWEFELLGENGLCILFFAAKGQNGKDLFDPALARRDGIFKRYTNGDIECYHISYFANAPGVPRRVANLRKNPGACLISNGPIGLTTPRPGEVHKAVLVKDGAHIQMAVDGRLIIDHTDDGARAGPAYAGGRIGFRQMQWTSARYRNFVVRELE